MAEYHTRSGGYSKRGVCVMVSRLERLQRRYEQSVEAAKAAKAELENLRREQDRKERIAARKARTRALIQAGGLVEIAGLLRLDKGALLGALLDVKKAAASGDNSARWKAAGDALLAERENASKAKTGQ